MVALIKLIDRLKFLFFCDFIALHDMQTQSSDENSVRPSVKCVLSDKMVERSVHIFISYERSFSLVF